MPTPEDLSSEILICYHLIVSTLVTGKETHFYISYLGNSEDNHILQVLKYNKAINFNPNTNRG